MTLSITDNIPNLQPSPICKRSLQIGRDYEPIRNAGQVSAEVAKALALSEYEKYHTARLEREASQSDGDLEQVVRKLKGKNKGNEGENSNVES